MLLHLYSKLFQASTHHHWIWCQLLCWPSNSKYKYFRWICVLFYRMNLNKFYFTFNLEFDVFISRPPNSNDAIKNNIETYTQKKNSNKNNIYTTKEMNERLWNRIRNVTCHHESLMNMFSLTFCGVKHLCSSFCIWLCAFNNNSVVCRKLVPFINNVLWQCLQEYLYSVVHFIECSLFMG